MTNKEITEMIKKYESKWGRLGYTNIMRPELNHSGAEGGTKMSSIANDLIAFRKKVAAGREANRQAHKTTVNVNDLNQRYFEELTTNGTLIHALPSLGEKRSDNKYYQKIDNYYSDGRARYFWSKDEWDAYQKEKNAKYAQQAEAERKNASQQSSAPKANHLAEAEAETAKRKEEAEAAKIKEENIRKNAAAASNAGADRAASESKSVNAQKSQASGAQAETGAKIDRALKEGGTKAAVREVTKTKEWDDYISVMKEAVNAGYDPLTMTRNQLKDADADLGKRAEEAEKKFREMYGGDDASKRDLKVELGKIAEEAINTAKSEKEAAKKTIADRDAAIKAGQKSEQNRQMNETRKENKQLYDDANELAAEKLSVNNKSAIDDIEMAISKSSGLKPHEVNKLVTEKASKYYSDEDKKKDEDARMALIEERLALYDEIDKLGNGTNDYNNIDKVRKAQELGRKINQMERDEYDKEIKATLDALEDLMNDPKYGKTAADRLEFDGLLYDITRDLNEYGKETHVNKQIQEFVDKYYKGAGKSAKHSAFDDEDYLAHADSNARGSFRQNAKYYKREGEPGRYRYYYTKEEYDAAHGKKNDAASAMKKIQQMHERHEPNVNTWIKEDGVYEKGNDGKFHKTDKDWKQMRQESIDKADKAIQDAAKQSGYKGLKKDIFDDERMQEMLTQYEGGFENYGWELNDNGSISGMTEDDDAYFKKMEDWMKSFKDSTGIDVTKNPDFQKALSDEIRKRYNSMKKQAVDRRNEASGNKKYAAAHSAMVDSEELMDEYSVFMERVNKGKEMNRLSHSSFISPAMLNRRYEEELDSKAILIHSGNFKYYNKIDLGNGKTRYFYTKAEWDAYNREKSSGNAADSEGAKYDAWKKEQAQKKAQAENIRKNTEAAGNAEKEKWESVKKTAAEAPKLASINIGANVAKAIGKSEMTHPLSQALSDNLGPDALSRALTSNLNSLSTEEKIANDRAEISRKNDEGRDAAIAKSRKIEQDRMKAYEIEENYNKAIEEYNVVAKDLEEEYFSDVKTQKEYIEAMEDLIDDMKDCYEDVDNPDGVEITWSEDGASYVASIPEYQEKINELSNAYTQKINEISDYHKNVKYATDDLNNLYDELHKISNEMQLVTIESQSKIYPYLTNVFKEVLD